jgi:hypothetical protein
MLLNSKIAHFYPYGNHGFLKKMIWSFANN